MEEKNKINQKQSVQIAEVIRDVCWIKKEIIEIKKQVFNELPHQINDLKKQLSYGLLIGIVSFLILQVILKVY